MAQRRMFSPEIVESDAFLEMPLSTQALYFHLGMYADDDGFVNPKKIVRMLGASEDDLKLLLIKNFLIAFDNLVVVIKHWRKNNLVRKDWYRPTTYVEQKEMLYVKENNTYTLDEKQGNKLLVNDSLTTRQHRLGKDSISKVNNKDNKYNNKDNNIVICDVDFVEQKTAEFIAEVKKTLQGVNLNQKQVSDIQSFVAYWTEPNKSKTKVKWELEKTWDMKRRISRWLKNSIQWGSNNQRNAGKNYDEE